jgi:hypothetical protein
VRNTLSVLVLLAFGSTGCSVLWPVFDVATRPLAKQATFEEVQKGYCDNIRFGLYDDAAALVEPALKNDFRAAQRRFREIRFTDYRVEAIEIDARRTEAVVNVVFTGYWLSSPYEQEVATTQRWRRVVPGQQWYVTPDLAAIHGPPGTPAGVSANGASR